MNTKGGCGGFYEYKRWVWWFLIIQKVGVVVFINSEGGCGGFY